MNKVNAASTDSLEILENVEAVAVEKIRGARLVGNVQNILNVFDTATARQIADGASWYDVAHAAAMDIGDGNLNMGAGMLAALSPRKEWTLNVIAAYEVKLHGNKAKGMLPDSRKKAVAIRDGASVMSEIGKRKDTGKKVRAFYEAIRNPRAIFATAVIDRHAVSVWVGETQTDKQLEKLQLKGQYETIATAYAEAASLRNVTVHTMQAVTWVTWRESK